MFEGRKSTLKQPVFSEITCRSFDGSSTKIQAVADLSAVVSPRSPSSPPPQDPAPVFVGFRPSRSGDDRPDATKNPSDATTQSTAVRARVDEPLFSPSALKSASTPNDVLAVSNVSQFELEPSAQPNHPAMNSVAPSAPQPDGIQAQPQVSSASLNASTSAAVPNALPFPINDIAAAAAHYLKTQLLSVAPSSFSTLGIFFSIFRSCMCSHEHILATCRSPFRSSRFRPRFFSEGFQHK